MALEPLQQPDSCPIREDLRFQRFTWIVERAGWVIMALVVVLALAGIFGGPTTREEAIDTSGRLRISYQHFQRHLDPAVIKLTVDVQGQSLIEVTFDQALIEAFEIQRVIPQPLEAHAHDGGLLMRFAASADTNAPAHIAIDGVPRGLGSVAGGIGLMGQSPARVSIFIYP